MSTRPAIACHRRISTGQALGDQRADESETIESVLRCGEAHAGDLTLPATLTLDATYALLTARPPSVTLVVNAPAHTREYGAIMTRGRLQCCATISSRLAASPETYVSDNELRASRTNERFSIPVRSRVPYHLEDGCCGSRALRGRRTRRKIAWIWYRRWGRCASPLARQTRGAAPRARLPV